VVVGYAAMAKGNLTSESPSSSSFSIESPKINIGGGTSRQERYVLDDSLTLHTSNGTQKSNRFEVSSTIPQGNNGVATAIGAHAVSLSWSSIQSDGLAGFTIMRCNEKFGSYSTVTTLGASTYTYIDEGLQADTVYYYIIAAYDDESNNWPVTDPLYVRTLQEPPNAVSRTWEHYR